MVHILHVHSTFSPGGKELRCVRLMNAFGDRATHTVLSAVPGALGARDLIDANVAVDFPDDHPALVGRPTPGRYRDLARYMRAFDLVLTYNWGAMDAVGARRMWGGPPLIHHEDGFNQDEIGRQKPARLWFRRLMLPAAHALVVPSEALAAIARKYWWKEPRLIPNGIALERFATASAAPRAAGETVVGTLAGLRAVKNLPLLVRAFAGAGVDGRLVIAGDGPERAAILAEAKALGILDRLALPGHLPPHEAVGRFDIFALSSDSEQQPVSLMEAMAAGLPVAATDVGDVRNMVAQANRHLIVPAGDAGALASAIAALARDPALRHRIGMENRDRALHYFDEGPMIQAYRALYGQALGGIHVLD